MSARTDLAKELTRAILSCEWTPQAMERAARDVLGDACSEWLPVLVSDVRERTVTPYAPPPQKLTRHILDFPGFDRVLASAKAKVQTAPHITAPARMTPLAVFAQAGVPQLTTPGALAEWLEIPTARLDWFADVPGRLAHRAEETLQHYSYTWIPKKNGPPRLIESPKAETKRMQRKILHEILDLVPPHDCAHGFRKGRSCISHAQLHAGERVVVALDLRSFFLTVPLARVHGLFRCLGYPWAVARLLTGLCSTATPHGVFEQVSNKDGHDWESRSLYQQPHLPQGAPTSPALANLCSRRMDCRLDGLARRLDSRYTRYADDMAFSGDDALAKRLNSLLRCVASVVKEEGFDINRRKTRVMRQGQRQFVTGLTINQHVNVPRTQYDALKATLHNCVRFGPASQNREDHPDFRNHLNGRITWVENVNLRRGEKLRALFDNIPW